MQNIIKEYILSESGKILHRKIKIDSEGNEYILHLGMKAFLKKLPEQQQGCFIVKIKQIAWYESK